MKRLLTVLVLTGSLIGCANLSKDDPPPDDAIADATKGKNLDFPVPRLPNYKEQFIDQLAAELDATPADSPIRVYAVDHYTLRRQVCAINGKQPTCQKMRQEE